MNAKKRLLNFFFNWMPTFAWGAMLLGGMLLAGPGGCAKHQPQIEPLPPAAVILAFGDSLTSGAGAGDQESYPAVLATLIGRKVVNAGVPGETTAGGLERLPRTLDEFQPALVILCLGGNDFLQRLDDRQTAENLRRMIRIIRDRNIGVILVGVPKPGLILKPAGFYKELAAEFDVPGEEVALKQALSSPALKSDQIHLNAAGYRKIASALADLIHKAGGV